MTAGRKAKVIISVDARVVEETAAYYDALTKAERLDDATWAAASAKAARKLHVDSDARRLTSNARRTGVLRRR